MPSFFFFHYSNRNQQIDYSVTFEREVGIVKKKKKKKNHLCSRFGGPWHKSVDGCGLHSGLG